MISMAADFGHALDGKLRSDSTAAIGIAIRTGLGGKSRHVRVQYLWIQEAIGEKRLSLEKVDTKYNIADVLTKHLSRDAFESHIVGMGYGVASGRAGKANDHNVCPHWRRGATSSRGGVRDIAFYVY